MEEKAFGWRIFVIIWVISVVERRKKGRRKGRNNWKEYYSISRVRKVRLEIMALYYNILKLF